MTTARGPQEVGCDRGCQEEGGQRHVSADLVPRLLRMSRKESHLCFHCLSAPFYLKVENALSNSGQDTLGAAALLSNPASLRNVQVVLLVFPTAQSTANLSRRQKADLLGTVGPP